MSTLEWALSAISRCEECTLSGARYSSRSINRNRNKDRNRPRFLRIGSFLGRLSRDVWGAPFGDIAARIGRRRTFCHEPTIITRVGLCIVNRTVSLRLIRKLRDRIQSSQHKNSNHSLTFYHRVRYNCYCYDNDHGNQQGQCRGLCSWGPSSRLRWILRCGGVRRPCCCLSLCVRQWCSRTPLQMNLGHPHHYN